MKKSIFLFTFSKSEFSSWFYSLLHGQKTINIKEKIFIKNHKNIVDLFI